MSEKPPTEIWTLAQSHDVKLVPTAGLPKYILADSAEKRIAELDHLLRESQEQTRVQAVVYEGRERRDKTRIAELEAELAKAREAARELLEAMSQAIGRHNAEISWPSRMCTCSQCREFRPLIAKAGDKGASE
jgi:hypothetical protein